MKEHITGYALALFSLAQDENKLQQYKDEALIITAAVESNLDITKLLDSRDLNNEKKQAIITTSFEGLNANLINFLLVLVERYKFYLVVRILKAFIKLVNESLNISEGVVYSITKLTQVQLSKIENKTNEILKKKVFLQNKLDSELVSGIKIVVGDEVIEDSIQSRLQLIKAELLEREDN